MNKKIPTRLALSIAAASCSALPYHAHAQSAQAAGLEQVFVTARKRDEGVQAVPISMQAMSSESLEQRNVREVQDLNVVVPGFRFISQGGRSNNDVLMRGLSKIPISDGVSAVVTYFANVALPPRGSNVPTFDIANIQVLKGPQGTLFGRNTLGGAVLVTPEAPNYEFGGYVRGAYGTKNYRNLEGAVDVPVVDDKVALRLAGQIRRQDGMNKNLSGGDDFDNVHQNSYRVSLLLNPTDTIENLTVFDHFEADEEPALEYIYRGNAAAWTPALGAFNTPDPTKGGITTRQQIEGYVAAQKAAGYHKGFTTADGYSQRKLWGISNDTSWDLGFATLRNIAGYRRQNNSELIDTAAVGPTTTYLPAPIAGQFGVPAGTYPLTVFFAASETHRKYLSDELQLFGTAWDDRLDWITGLYYSKDESAGENGTQFTQFSITGTPRAPTTSHSENTSKAVFAQIGLDISDWTLDGLKYNLGVRYSQDDVWACGGTIPGQNRYLSVNECKSNVSVVGLGTIENDSSEVSWTTGFDWQINPDTLVYITSRHGYRGANVNTPLFESVYTTGASTACTGSTLGGNQCPDLRPFQKTDPETITDVEIGVKNDWAVGDVRGRINVAAYISKYKDSVQLLNVTPFALPRSTPDVPSQTSVGVNAADMTIQGVETDLTVIPVPSLTLSLSAAYTDQKVDKVNNVVPGVSLTKEQITLQSPEFTATFAFAWTLPVRPLDGELILSGDYLHTDKFGGQFGENLPGYEVTNFRLNWKDIGNSGLDIGAYLRNAFDEDYFSSAVALTPALPVSTLRTGDPRTWGVEATYHF